MRNIAIIPARSGSKGLPDKNTKPLAGKPLLAYSIEAAIASGVFHEVMVSTDSMQYAEIARRWGANVPFLRSDALSGDRASSWDVVREVLAKYQQKGEVFDAFCLLQPTSPLRTSEDIVNAYQIFSSAPVAVVSVCEVDHPPMWCNVLPADNSLKGFIARDGNQRRQDVGKYYRINGAIYFVRVSALHEDDFLYRDGSFAYVMSKDRSIDIDDAVDFELAEFLLHRK